MTDRFNPMSPEMKAAAKAALHRETAAMANQLIADAEAGNITIAAAVNKAFSLGGEFAVRQFRLEGVQ